MTAQEYYRHLRYTGYDAITAAGIVVTALMVQVSVFR